MSEMHDLPQAEFEVMGVLWEKKRATVKEVHVELSKTRKLAYTTVATLLKRLQQRGVVEAREENFAYVYEPLVQRDEVVRRKLDDIVKRLFRGDLSPLAAYIAERKNLSPEQIAALEDMVASTDSEKEAEDESSL